MVKTKVPPDLPGAPSFEEHPGSILPQSGHVSVCCVWHDYDGIPSQWCEAIEPIRKA